MAAAPVAARIAGNELADSLRNYGHLMIRASLFACERLDGRFVINRATMTPIGFSWEQGLKQAVASGTSPELLLAVPALPALLTWAPPIGVLADPQRRPEVRRLLVFAATMELARRRIETRLVVREEQSGYCFFDRILLCGKSSLQWSQGLDDGDWGPCANNDRSRAMRAVLRPPAPSFADGGGTSANDATTATNDETPLLSEEFATNSNDATVDAEQKSAPRILSPAEWAVAAQRLNASDAPADRLEQHVDDTARVAGIPPDAVSSEIASPTVTDFPLGRTPDEANSALAAIDAPADAASGTHDDANHSWVRWGENLLRSKDPYYSLHKWELNRALTAAADEGQSLAEDEIRSSPFSYDSRGQPIPAASDQLDRHRVAAQINNAMYGTEDPQPANAVERYLGRVAGGFGANPVMGAIFPWATTAGELLGEGAADINKATGAHMPDWLARLLGSGGSAAVVASLVPRALSWLGEVGARFRAAGIGAEARQRLSSRSGASFQDESSVSSESQVPSSTIEGSTPDSNRSALSVAGSHSSEGEPEDLYDTRDDFDSFLKKRGYDDANPLVHNLGARDYVLQMGKELKSEFFVAYDAAKQDFAHVGTSYVKDAVGVPADLVEDALSPDRRIIFHHNHPDNTGLSHEDIWLLALPGMRWIVSHGRQGDLSAARLTDGAMQAMLRRGVDFDQTYLRWNAFGRLWRGIGAASKWPLLSAVDRGDLSASKANQLFVEITNRALERAGLVEYLSSYRIPSPARFGYLQDQADEIAQTGVQAIFPELKGYVSNPSPKSVRVDEGMARISKAGIDDAPGRLERSLGGRVCEGGVARAWRD